MNEIRQAKENYIKYCHEKAKYEYLQTKILKLAYSFHNLDINKFYKMICKSYEITNKLYNIEQKIILDKNYKFYSYICDNANWSDYGLSRRTTFRKINEFAKNYNKIMEAL